MPRRNKLTDEQAAELRAVWELMRSLPRSANELGQRFGISGESVRRYAQPNYRREVQCRTKCRRAGIPYEKPEVRT